jgi:hypothetical protein
MFARKNIRKLNQKGFSHLVLPFLIIVTIGAIGTYVLLRTHADSVTTSTQPTVLESPAVKLSDPLHFNDTWWYWPAKAAGYTKYTIYVTPKADGTPDGYFFSTGFYFQHQVGVSGFGYLGIQTNVQGLNAKGSIFSIWGSTKAIGGQQETNFSEVGGSGWSVRDGYNWKVGTKYQLTLQYLSTSSAGNIWGAYVGNISTGVQNRIGELVTPKSFGMLSDVTNSFHERYSGQTNTCALHYSEVEFTNPYMDGGTVVPESYTNYQPNVEGCTNYQTINIPGGYESAIGGKVN